MQDINYLLTTPPPSLNVMATPWRTIMINTCKWVCDDCWWCMYVQWEGQAVFPAPGNSSLTITGMCRGFPAVQVSSITHTHTHTHARTHARTNFLYTDSYEDRRILFISSLVFSRYWSPSLQGHRYRYIGEKYERIFRIIEQTERKHCWHLAFCVWGRPCLSPLRQYRLSTSLTLHGLWVAMPKWT